MSRSGYSDDCDGWALIRWRGAVSSAIKGARGQQLLRELAAAMDATPEKRLIAESLSDSDGYCALGVVGAARGTDLTSIDSHNWAAVAKTFGIAKALAREIVFENDEGGHWDETPEYRFRRVRAWVQLQIVETTPPQEPTR